MNKFIVFTAPSGSGKTTIVRHLLRAVPNLAFSVSACSRHQRPNETEGKDYYFLTPEVFKQKIDDNQFVEWEEVYADNLYGTLKSEVKRLFEEGKSIVFDIDVQGALNLKKQFGDQALTVFVQVPSMETLEQRLRNRKTETDEKIAIRIQKAQNELQFANQFDTILLNDDLNRTLKRAEWIVEEFLNR